MILHKTINNKWQLQKSFLSKFTITLGLSSILFITPIFVNEARASKGHAPMTIDPIKKAFFDSIGKPEDNPILYPKYINKESPKTYENQNENTENSENNTNKVNHENSTQKNNVFIDKNGNPVTNQFVKISNDYGHYLDENGQIVKFKLVHAPNKTYFYAPSDGKIPLGKSGGFTVSDKRYYREKNGQLKLGWVKNHGKSFYYSPHLLRNCYEKIAGKDYQFNKFGEAIELNSYSVKNEWSYSRGYLSGPRVRDRNVGKDHVIISLAHQYMWVFKNHKLVISTPIISGKPSTPTIRGNFSIQGKARNKTLVGPDYRSPVKYWVPFAGSYGIHDAAWQKSRNFRKNSSSYLRVGSHGCVNILPSIMPKIFNNVFLGSAVTIY